MSLGFSIHDVLAAINTCYKVYQSIKDAPGDLATVQKNATALANLLTEVKLVLDDSTSSIQPALIMSLKGRQTLNESVSACEHTLEKLEAILTKYAALTKPRKRDRVSIKMLRFTMKDAKELPEIRRNLRMQLQILNNMWTVAECSTSHEEDPIKVKRHAEIMDMLHKIHEAMLVRKENPNALLPSQDIRTGEINNPTSAEASVQRSCNPVNVLNNAERVKSELMLVGDEDHDQRSEDLSYEDPLRSRLQEKSSDDDEATPKNILLNGDHDDWTSSVFPQVLADGSSFLDIDCVKPSTSIVSGMIEKETTNISTANEIPTPKPAAHAMCFLCLKLVPVQNIMDHMAFGHEAAIKERLMGLAFPNAPTSPSPSIKTTPPSSVTDDVQGSNAAGGTRDLPISCPICHVSVNLNELKEHLDTHCSLVEASNTITWKRVLEIGDQSR
ncbi:hypothetical protein EX30DRAFT_130083 [Ascodesmis nigricans]|uniref:Uncharacterized protein n=1 Tax=Ascodesmis nigricans TaxID=341454 RepID=A0A4S2MNM5_9PEZI|nr:hypothetical protein EX30DRAFT_130083 [Ascodesmis nigricans]